MNDNIAPVIVGCLLVLVGAVGLSYRLGSSEESNRIYQKCLIKNTETPHGKAVGICKEVVQ